MLHLLAEYAADRDLTAKPGYAPVDVAFFIDVAPPGHVSVEDRRTKKSKKELRIRGCPRLSLGELKAIGSGARHFLVDSLDVVANLTKNEQTAPTEKQQAKHDYFVAQLAEATGAEPLLEAAVAALRDETTLGNIVAALRENKAKPTDKATFRVDGKVIVRRPTWQGWWDEFREAVAASKAKKQAKKSKRGAKSAPKMRCLLTGELIEPAATHPKVAGLADVGGQSSGDVLASFKQGAFQHYGLAQSANAAMSEEAAKLYSAALTHAIREQSLRLGESKVVYWYTGLDDVPAGERLNPIGAIHSPTAEETAEETAGQTAGQTALATAVRPAKRTRRRPKDLPPPDPETRRRERRERSERSAVAKLDRLRSGGHGPAIDASRYVVLLLTANSGRIVIRQVREGTLASLAAAQDAWFDDLAIGDRSGDGLAPPPKFAAVLGAIVRDFGDLTAPLEEAVWLAALDPKRPIPAPAVVGALNRFRVSVIEDQTPLHAQVGLLRASLLRSDDYRSRMSATPQDLPMPETLDASGDQPAAYQYGRVLALLADIQRAALGNVGAGVIQRYFSAASATPALVIGRLVRLAQTGHLPKLDPGLRNWFEDRLAAVWAPLSVESVRATPLTLQDQTLFALGYYHQRAERPPRKDSSSDSSADSDEVAAAAKAADADD